MGSHGIRDRVAIVSVGCTPFGEHWDRSVDDLMVQAVGETLEGVGLDKQDIDAYWLGTAQRSCGITLAKPLELQGKPVSRVEKSVTLPPADATTAVISDTMPGRSAPCTESR